jgi:hypothetical protein
MAVPRAVPRWRFPLAGAQAAFFLARSPVPLEIIG